MTQFQSATQIRQKHTKSNCCDWPGNGATWALTPNGDDAPVVAADADAGAEVGQKRAREGPKREIPRGL